LVQNPTHNDKTRTTIITKVKAKFFSLAAKGKWSSSHARCTFREVSHVMLLFGFDSALEDRKSLFRCFVKKKVYIPDVLSLSITIHGLISNHSVTRIGIDTSYVEDMVQVELPGPAGKTETKAQAKALDRTPSHRKKMMNDITLGRDGREAMIMGKYHVVLPFSFSPPGASPVSDFTHL
jgi:hypothetical protein